MRVAADPGLTGGRGGDVNIRAGTLRVAGRSSITTTALGTGRAGDVSVDAGSVFVTGGATVGSASAPIGTAAAGAAPGAAGGVGVRAADRIVVSGGAAVSVESSPESGLAGAAAGDVTLRAGRDVEILGNGNPDAPGGTRVTAGAPGGDGGNVTLTAGRSIRVSHALVTAEAKNNGGQILLDPPVVVLDGSDINGLSGGKPVVVRIVTDNLLRSGDRIRTNQPQSFPETNLAASIAALDASLVAPGVRLAPVCGALGFSTSSFVTTGRGGSPPNPAVGRRTGSSRRPATTPAVTGVVTCDEAISRLIRRPDSLDGITET